MRDYPPADELLEAVAAFLDEEVKPLLEGGQRFKSIVAANACRVAAREAVLGPALIESQCSGLWQLLEKAGQAPGERDLALLATELARELCVGISGGDYDGGESRARLLQWLRRDVAARLRINDPAFLERVDTDGG